jgi:NAD(P)-dependent dehydrogenase (short-subunit alcohol dehydrogenase family)
VGRVQGKVAIITGAASGIGEGTAQLFAEEGALLLLLDRDGPGLERVASALREGGAQVEAVAGDVSDRATVEAAVARAIEVYGRIDIAFNNAGIMRSRDLREFPEEEWDELLDINLKSMYLMCRAVIPHMLAQGGGSIINTSSVMATLTEPGYEAYTTSKAGAMGLTKAVAVSYAEQGVRCNCICPGWVDTPMNRKLADELGGVDKLTPLIKQQQPLGRMASAREVAHAVLFLASDDSSAVTGSALYVDGAASAAI